MYIKIKFSPFDDYVLKHENGYEGPTSKKVWFKTKL